MSVEKGSCGRIQIIVPSIYDHRENNRIAALYVYHITAQDLDLCRVYCYWGSGNAITNRDEAIDKVLKEIFDQKSLSPCGQHLSDVQMRRASYVVFAVEGAELLSDRSLRIVNKQNGLGGAGFESGHTFSNATPNPFYGTYGSHKLGIVSVMNSIYDLNEGKLGEEVDDHFRISCLDKDSKDILHRPHKGDLKATSDHESGGTNMGPPLPPP